MRWAAHILMLAAVMTLGTSQAFAGSDGYKIGDVTPGGSDIVADGIAPESAKIVGEAGLYLDEITDHLEASFGPIETVLHEVVSEYVHVDVLPIQPTEDRPYWTLVTVGMSDKPMTLPELVNDPEDWDRAELVITLPASWADSVEELQSEQRWDPIAILKELARYPHYALTWFGPGHSIPLLEMKVPDSRMDGVMFHWPLSWEESVMQLRARDGELINFYSIYILYSEEMQAKLEIGADPLHEAFRMAGQLDVFRPDRVSLVFDGKLLGMWPI